MKSRLSILWMLFVSNILYAQNVSKVNNFERQITLLLNGTLDTLSLPSNLKVPICFLFEQEDMIDQKDKKQHPDAQLSLADFRPVVKKDVIIKHHNYYTLLVHSKKDFQVRLVTFRPDGSPIESFLLHDRYGYLYQKNYRSFSFHKKFHFDTATQQFCVYNLVLGYEAYPSYDSPVFSPIYFQSYNQVGIDAKGRFLLQSSKLIQDYPFSTAEKKIAYSTLEHEDIQLVHAYDKNIEDSKLWAKHGVHYQNKRAADTIVVDVQSFEAYSKAFLGLNPSEDVVITAIACKHKNSMIINMDGNTETLENWLIYESNWVQLNPEKMVFEANPFDKEDQYKFPKYALSSIEKAIRNQIFKNTPEDFIPESYAASTSVAMKRITFKIDCLKAAQTKSIVFIFKFDYGC